MSWVKIDDQFYDNPTNRTLGPAGRDLYIAGLCYCSKGLTDGRIQKIDVPLLLAQAQAKPTTVKKLVDAGRWIDEGDTYMVPQYLNYNPSSDKVRSDREANAERQKRWRESRRDSPVTRAVSNGSGDTVSNGPPVPSRPQLSSSSHRSSRSSPDSDPDDDLDQLWTLLADRRAELEHPDGDGINRPDAYRAKLISDHRERLHNKARALRDEHPDWTIDQLADELDPVTAPRAGNVPTAEESDEWLAEQKAREEQAVPMPEHMKRR